MRLNKNEPLCDYLSNKLPHLVEDDYFNPINQSVISVPQSAPKGAILRTESSLDLIKRVMDLNSSWIECGHVAGENRNNVSCTLSIKEGEWEEIREELWVYRGSYNGIALIPYDGGSYKQAPFEEITEEHFRQLEGSLRSIDLTKITEDIDNTTLTSEIACSGGTCEII